MLKQRRIILESARRIAAAAERAVEDYIPEAAEVHSDFTGVVLARMKQAMDNYKTRGVRWNAKTFARQRRGDEESVADIFGVVEFDLPECHVNKGFLAQTIHFERGQSFATGEWEGLADQCKRLCAMTAESFVFVYSRAGIIVLPAMALASATTPFDPHDAYSRTLLRFYQDHFECFAGDLQLGSNDAEDLEKVQARHAFFLRATQFQTAEGVQMKLGADF